MLTIKNIDKAIGMMCYGRDIYHIRTTTNTIGEQAYVFEFDAIQDGQVPMGYNKPTEVHLIRHADKDGRYKVFVMGLAATTEATVTNDSIINKHGLWVVVSYCLERAKEFWDNKKN